MISLSSPANPLLCANAVMPESASAAAASADMICFFVVSPHKILLFAVNIISMFLPERVKNHVDIIAAAIFHKQRQYSPVKPKLRAV